MKVVELKHINKEFRRGNNVTKAVSDVSFHLAKGESMAIMGSSGSGKSTLLNIIGGLDRASSGEIKVNDVDLNSMNDRRISEFRNQTIGFVFQFFNLLDYLTATENVMLQIMLGGKSPKDARGKAEELLTKVHLEHRLNYYPKHLSGGEMQRVAIARSLANSPSLLLADEPTANLDKASAESVLDLFGEIADSGVSIITITHDHNVSKRYANVIHLSQGKITDK